MAVSKKFPGDTLFFIFEQDFEFHPQRQNEGDHDAHAQELGTSSAASWQYEASSAAGWTTRGTKRKDANQKDVIGEDSHAANMVKLVTVAARNNVGELFWLGYNPKFNKNKNAQPRIGFGTQLVAVSQQGAERLLFDMKKSTTSPDHIDRWLKKYCENFERSNGRCGYVFPPIGCFGEHVSECCPSEGTRKTWWEEPYTAEGTRPQHDKNGQRPKEIYAFSQDGKGHADMKAKVLDEHFNGDMLLWRTCWRVPKTAGPQELRGIWKEGKEERWVPSSSDMSPRCMRLADE